MSGIQIKTTQGLEDYIEYLLEMTIMPHERDPQGYTDPEMKQYYLGRRHALQDIKNALINPSNNGDKK